VIDPILNPIITYRPQNPPTLTHKAETQKETMTQEKDPTKFYTKKPQPWLTKERHKKNSIPKKDFKKITPKNPIYTHKTETQNKIWHNQKDPEKI